MSLVRVAVIGGGMGALVWWLTRQADYGLTPESSTDAGTLPFTDGGFMDVALGVAGAVFGGGQGMRKQMSFAGIELLKQFEGYRSQVYDANPPKRDWTIGYGHKLKAGETFKNGVSESTARSLLVADIGFAEDRVSRNITIDLSQSQFDALVSLAYNLTISSWLAASARINRGESASSVFNRYVYGGGVKLGGLVTRRGLEVAMYFKDSGGVA